MFQLPKGNPLFENLAATKLKLPEIMSKLSTAGFTGYASFIFQAATVLLVFESGQLVSVMHREQNGERQSGLEAVTALTRLMLTSGSGTLNVYKLSKDLAMCIHALLQGEILYKAQELKLIDIKALLEKIKSDQLNGCLRIYTDDRSAMIFYKGGNPLGFFHDGSQEIETSSSESQKIATLPGAKIDLFSTQSADELLGTNLLEVINVQNLWDSAVALQQSEAEKIEREREARESKNVALKLASLEEQLKVIATECLGKVGRGILDKEIAGLGGNSCLLDSTKVASLLTATERAAKLLVSSSSIKLMQEKLNAAIVAAQQDN